MSPAALDVERRRSGVERQVDQARTAQIEGGHAARRLGDLRHAEDAETLRSVEEKVTQWVDSFEETPTHTDARERSSLAGDDGLLERMGRPARRDTRAARRAPRKRRV